MNVPKIASVCVYCIYFLQATSGHTYVDEAVAGTREAVKDLHDTIETAASASGAVSTLVDSIQKASMKVRKCLPTASCCKPACFGSWLMWRSSIRVLQVLHLVVEASRYSINLLTTAAW